MATKWHTRHEYIRTTICSDTDGGRKHHYNNWWLDVWRYGEVVWREEKKPEKQRQKFVEFVVKKEMQKKMVIYFCSTNLVTSSFLESILTKYRLVSFKYRYTVWC